ncbi:MAG TPA: hypothetical protein DCM45_04760, partial [Clostridiales bacterium]|nr:hypothetical protein [Clostridiales bacterium]
VDALILARRMTGRRLGEDVEKAYRKNLLSFIGKKGLTYRRNSFSEDVIIDHQSEFKDSASMIDQRATLLALCTLYESTGDEHYKAAADNLCAGLKDIARKERDYWYYPASEYTDTGWPSFDAVHTKLAVDPCAFWGRQIMPLLKWHELTGNRDAFELCENFASYIMNHSSVFGPDGRWSGAHEFRNGHSHTRMGTLASLARLGRFTCDDEMIQFAKRGFDWFAHEKCTTFGWTPGDLGDQQYEHETCTLVDAIDTAIQLALSGYVSYWSIVEKYVRNHLTEAQLKDTSWIEQSDSKANDIPGQKTYYRVADRLKGAFAGYAAPNDFVYAGEWGRGHIMDVQTCCLGAGTRGLYLAWDHIVTTNGNGRVSINLLFNHNCEWLELKSCLPHEGCLSVIAKKDMSDLIIRIPEWVPFGAVRLLRGDGSESLTGRQLPWVKQIFMRVSDVKAGETITISFPVMTRQTVEQAATLTYQIKWRGDDVMAIDPPGSYYPLYTRRQIQNQVVYVEKRLCEKKGQL